jgi:LysM repeat protein
VSKRFKISVAELLRFNNLKQGGPFVVGQVLKIPQKGEVTGNTYKVKPGDSVAKIADFHGVSQFDLRRINGMTAKQKLKVGQSIIIPMTLRGGVSKGHVVRKGDTIASIARKYHVKIKNLMAANKLGKNSCLQPGRTLIIPEKEDTGRYRPVKVNKLVKSGRKIKGGVEHTVQSGQNIWIIARAYNVKGKTIAKRNHITTSTPLKVGQKLIIPGARSVVPVRVKGYSIQPVRFVRVRNNKSMTLKLLKRNGAVSPYARKKLSFLSRPLSKKYRKRKYRKRYKLLHPRLIHMLQRVAERYPGKTIEIISGYRPGQRGSESQHTAGRAMDFRVSGVSNRELYEFCTQLPKSGCGYYPNSVFIHMDARKKSAVWTDLAGPGEKARYVHWDTYKKEESHGDLHPGKEESIKNKSGLDKD